MISRIKALRPFGQLVALLLIGAVSFFLFSTIITLIITAVYSDFPLSDSSYLQKAHPILFMLLTIVPLQLGFLFIPGYIYMKISPMHSWPIQVKGQGFIKTSISTLLFVAMFLLIPLATKINAIPLEFFGWYNDLMEVHDEQLAMITSFVQHDFYTFLTAAALISLLTGVAEEYFFRGFIFRQLIDNKINLYISWCLSGFIFALLHFNYVQFLPLFLFGIVLAIIYTLVGKLWLSIALHSVNNLIQLIWVRYDYSPNWMEEINYKITIPSILVLTGLIYIVYRVTVPRN